MQSSHHKVMLTWELTPKLRSVVCVTKYQCEWRYISFWAPGFGHQYCYTVMNILLSLSLSIWFQSFSTELKSCLPQNTKCVEMKSWMRLQNEVLLKIAMSSFSFRVEDSQKNIHILLLKHSNNDWSFFLLKRAVCLSARNSCIKFCTRFLYLSIVIRITFEKWKKRVPNFLKEQTNTKIKYIITLTTK